MVLSPNDLATKRPFVRLGDQPCSDRIIAEVFPFFRLRLVSAQDVVEIAGLPFELAVGDDCFQGLDPGSKRDGAQARPREEVEVIGHQHVAARPPIVMRGAVVEELAHALVDRVVREEIFCPMQRADGKEIHRPSVIEPNEVETTQTFGLVFHLRTTMSLDPDVGHVFRRGGVWVSNLRRMRTMVPHPARSGRLRKAPARQVIADLRRTAPRR